MKGKKLDFQLLAVKFLCAHIFVNWKYSQKYFKKRLHAFLFSNLKNQFFSYSWENFYWLFWWENLTCICNTWNEFYYKYNDFLNFFVFSKNLCYSVNVCCYVTFSLHIQYDNGLNFMSRLVDLYLRITNSYKRYCLYSSPYVFLGLNNDLILPKFF